MNYQKWRKTVKKFVNAVILLLMMELGTMNALAESPSRIRFLTPFFTAGIPEVEGNTPVSESYSVPVPVPLIGSLPIDLNLDGSYKENLSKELSSKGYSVYYVHSNGWGVGYTELTFNYEVELIATDDFVGSVGGFGLGIGLDFTLAKNGTMFAIEKIMVNTGFLDILYSWENVFFEKLSLTAGGGLPILYANSNVNLELFPQESNEYVELVETEVERVINDIRPESAMSIGVFGMVGYSLGPVEILLGHRQNFFKAAYAIGFGSKKTRRELRTNETSIGFGYIF